MTYSQLSAPLCALFISNGGIRVCSKHPLVKAGGGANQS